MTNEAMLLMPLLSKDEVELSKVVNGKSGLASQMQKENNQKRAVLLEAVDVILSADSSSSANDAVLKTLNSEIKDIDDEIAILGSVVGKKRLFASTEQAKQKSHKLVSATTNIAPHQTAKTEQQKLNDSCQFVINATTYNTQLSAAFDVIIKDYAIAKESTNETLMALGITEKIFEVIRNYKSANKAWLIKSLIILNNMVANAHCVTQFAHIMDTISIPDIMNLMMSPINDIQEQAIWVLDNICQDFGTYRNVLLESGILNEISNILATKCKNAVAGNVTRLLSHLTYHGGLQPIDKFLDVIETLLPRLLNWLQFSSMKAVSLNTYHALSNLTDNNEAVASIVCQHKNLLMKMIGIIESKSVNADIQAAALDVLRNLAAGSTENSKILVSLGILHPLKRLIGSKDVWIAGIACATLSNLCGDDQDVIQAVFSLGFVKLLLNWMDTSIQPDVVMYSQYAVMFMFHGATGNQTHTLLEAGVLHRVLQLLPETADDCKKQSHGMFYEVLRCIEAALFKFECVVDFNKVASIMDAANGWERVQFLAKSDADNVKELALTISCNRMRNIVATEEENNSSEK